MGCTFVLERLNKSLFGTRFDVSIHDLRCIHVFYYFSTMFHFFYYYLISNELVSSAKPMQAWVVIFVPKIAGLHVNDEQATVHDYFG